MSSQILFANGTYCGDVSGNLPKGQGRFNFNDGTHCEGKWIQNKRSMVRGEGKFVDSDYRLFKITWMVDSTRNMVLISSRLPQSIQVDPNNIMERAERVVCNVQPKGAKSADKPVVSKIDTMRSLSKNGDIDAMMWVIRYYQKHNLMMAAIYTQKLLRVSPDSVEKEWLSNALKRDFEHTMDIIEQQSALGNDKFKSYLIMAIESSDEFSNRIQRRILNSGEAEVAYIKLNKDLDPDFQQCVGICLFENHNESFINWIENSYASGSKEAYRFIATHRASFDGIDLSKFSTEYKECKNKEKLIQKVIQNNGNNRVIKLKEFDKKSSVDYVDGLKYASYKLYNEALKRYINAYQKGFIDVREDILEILKVADDHERRIEFLDQYMVFIDDFIDYLKNQSSGGNKEATQIIVDYYDYKGNKELAAHYYSLLHPECARILKPVSTTHPQMYMKPHNTGPYASIKNPDLDKPGEYKERNWNDISY